MLSMNIFEAARRWLGLKSPLSIAEQKRQLERKLRADRWSRAAAVAEVARRFKKND